MDVSFSSPSLVCLETFFHGTLEEKGRSRDGWGSVNEPANHQSRHSMRKSWGLHRVSGGASGMMLARIYSDNASNASMKTIFWTCC